MGDDRTLRVQQDVLGDAPEQRLADRGAAATADTDVARVPVVCVPHELIGRVADEADRLVVVGRPARNLGGDLPCALSDVVEGDGLARVIEAVLFEFSERGLTQHVDDVELLPERLGVFRTLYHGTTLPIDSFDAGNYWHCCKRVGVERPYSFHWTLPVDGRTTEGCCSIRRVCLVRRVFEAYPRWFRNMPASTDGSRAVVDRLSLPSFETAGIWVSIAVLGVGILAPPIGGLEREMQLVLTVFVFALVLWLTEAVPYVVSSTLAPILLYALGLVPAFEDAVTGFASTLVFFLLLLLLLGGAISEVGLGKIVAGRMLSTQSTPRTTVRSLATHMVALSLLMPSAVARAVTFIPVVNRMTDAYGLPADGSFRKVSFIVLGHINPIGSMMLMTGGGMAIITSQLINESVRTVTWVQWAVYMIPPMALLFWLSTVSALVVYGVDDDRTLESAGHARANGGTDGDDNCGWDLGQVDTGGDTVDDADDDGIQTGGVGSDLTRDQRTVAVVMLGAVVAWIAGSFAGVPTILPAAVAVAILSVPAVGIVDRDLIADVSWGILFLIGAMFSILDAMEATGTLDYVVGRLIEVVPFGTMAPWLVVGTLLALAVFIRLWFSTASAAIVVTLPIIMEFGSVLGVDRLYLALSVLIVVGSTTFFPFNTTSVLLSYDKGPLGLRDVLAFGLVTMVHGAVVIVLSWLFYWPLVV